MPTFYLEKVRLDFPKGITILIANILLSTIYKWIQFDRYIFSFDHWLHCHFSFQKEIQYTYIKHFLPGKIFLTCLTMISTHSSLLPIVDNVDNTALNVLAIWSKTSITSTSVIEFGSWSSELSKMLHNIGVIWSRWSLMFWICDPLITSEDSFFTALILFKASVMTLSNSSIPKDEKDCELLARYIQSCYISVRFIRASIHLQYFHC